MIVPLKKICVITVENKKNIIKKLGKIGVIDIKTEQENATISELKSELEKIAEARHIVLTKITGPEKCYENVNEIINKIIEIDKIEDEILSRKNELLEKLEFYKLFGENIKISYINELKSKGLNLYFYETDDKKIKEDAITVIEKDNKILAVTLKKFITEKEITLPDMEYEEIEKELKELEEKEKVILEEYKNIGMCTKCINDYEKIIENKIKILEKENSVKEYKEYNVNIISGFIREDNIKKIEEESKKNGWAFLIEDIKEEDDPPVELKNIKHVENIIYPFYEFMGAWPSPFGKDPSVIFAIFIIIFGAILIGDAGYGISFIIAGFLLRKKINLPFIYYLGAGCIVWGSITGTWFSNAWLVQNTPLKYLVIENLSSYYISGEKAGQLNTNIQSTMGLMFIFGGIHLTIAKIMAMSKSISKNLIILGDIFLIWGMVYIIRFLMAGDKTTYIILPLLILGLALGIIGILLSKDKISKKIINVLSRPMVLINVFSDSMSYIRLFAVGFASLIVGMVATLIADMVGNIIIGAVIFIVINSINLALGLIAILVHAVRLNNLEFANNSEIKLGNKRFMPFKIEN